MTTENMTPKERLEFISELIGLFFDANGTIEATFHAWTRDDLTVFSWPPVENKDVAITMVKDLLKEMRAEKYVLVDECWMVYLSHEEAERHGTKAVSEHPDRREAVMFTYEDLTGQVVTAHRFILRPEHGKPKLTPLEIMDMTDVKSEGRMVGLLIPDKSKQH